MTINDCNNLVQYYFTVGEHPIFTLHHGNSKSSTVYKQTNYSVLQSMKEICKENDPIATIELIDLGAGDVVGRSSAGSRLPNIRQITCAKRKLKFKLPDTMAKCKTGVRPDRFTFMRCVVAATEVLGTNR